MVLELNIIMIIARRTESVNEGVINAAVNCFHMRPVNLTLLTLLALRCLQLKFYFYYAACLQSFKHNMHNIFSRPIRI